MILTVAATLLLLYAFVHALLLLGTFRFERSSASVWFLRAMLLAMAYDNVMMAVGPLAIDSPLYAPANVPRYIAHAGLLPFMLLFAVTMLRRRGPSIVDKPAMRAGLVLFTAMALGYGFVMDVAQLELGPESILGHVRLVSLDSVPPFATILTNLLVLPVAALLWRRGGTGLLFSGALFIFIVNGATGAMPWGFLAGNAAEVVFIFCMLVAEAGSLAELRAVMLPGGERPAPATH